MDKSQPIRTPQKRKVSWDFWKVTLKEEYNEKIRKGPVTNVTDTTLVLVPTVAKWGNQWHTKNPRKVL